LGWGKSEYKQKNIKCIDLGTFIWKLL
jgi:hypothetical protein